MKKSKLITMALSFLLTIGMVSAGFAAWVISAPTVKSVEGNVTVDTVTDKRIELSIVEDDGKKLPVVFGAKTEGVTPNNWLSLTDDVKTEDLISEFSFTIDNQKKLYDAGVRNINIEFSIKANEFVKYTTTDNDGYGAYITIPDNEKNLPSVKVDNGEADTVKSVIVPIANSDEKITVTVKYSFGWGQIFGSTNPYKYFSDKTNPNGYVVGDSGEVWADYAVRTLKKIEELADAKFGITVKATVVEETTQP